MSDAAGSVPHTPGALRADEIMTDEDFVKAIEAMGGENDNDIGELLKVMNENRIISWEEAERILNDTGSAPVKSSLPEQTRPTEPDNDTDVDQCIQKLLDNDTGLKEVNLNNMKRTPIPQIRRLIEALAYNEHCERLSLANMGLYDNDIAVLITVVEMNTALKKLNLETNYLSGDFFAKLFKAALVNQTLEEVKAVNQGVSFATVAEKEIIDSIVANTGLTKISINLRLPEGRHKVENATLRNGEYRKFIYTSLERILRREAAKKAKWEAEELAKNPVAAPANANDTTKEPVAPKPTTSVAPNKPALTKPVTSNVANPTVASTAKEKKKENAAEIPEKVPEKKPLVPKKKEINANTAEKVPEKKPLATNAEKIPEKKPVVPKKKVDESPPATPQDKKVSSKISALARRISDADQSPTPVIRINVPVKKGGPVPAKKPVLSSERTATENAKDEVKPSKLPEKKPVVESKVQAMKNRLLKNEPAPANTFVPKDKKIPAPLKQTKPISEANGVLPAEKKPRLSEVKKDPSEDAVSKEDDSHNVEKSTASPPAKKPAKKIVKKKPDSLPKPLSDAERAKAENELSPDKEEEEKNAKTPPKPPPKPTSAAPPVAPRKRLG
ncbi:Tropomodulin [Ancylostoma ceylanicum]|uniref:Tropomodulin n=1 Tax=Ancylostoma ceylanicum TaxID=53326 RepID=A0A0D6LNL2_9BILA|nr:Tropomodulin [Ancylostoma ceylanicum]